MEPFRVRGASEADLERLCEIWDECFPVGRNYFLTGISTLPGRDWEDSRILERDGEIVSVLNLYRMPVRFGAATLAMGGIGDVATPRAHRKQGYSSRLLADSQRYLAGRGCSLSYLFSGLTSFYGRCGWSPAPVPLARLVRFTSPAPSVAFRSAGEGDVPALADIHAAFFAPCFGMVERGPEYWRQRIFSPLHRVELAEREGRAVAYAILDVNPDRHGGFKEAACLPGQESSAGALLSRLAQEYRPTRIPPQGRFLLDLMLEQNLEGREHGLMAMVLDWNLLAGQMAPEFARRLSHVCGRVVLEVENPSRPGGLIFEPGMVRARKDEVADARLGSDAFWTLLCGRTDPETTLPHLPPAHRETLFAAFPKLEFFFSSADFF